MEEANGNTCNETIHMNEFNKEEKQISIVKECEMKNETNTTNCSSIIDTSEKSEKITETQDVCKSPLEKMVCINENEEKLSNDSFAESETEIHETMSKLMDMLDKNINDVKSLIAEPLVTNNLPNNKIDITDKCDIQVIEVTNIKNSDDNCSSVKSCSDNMSDGIEDEIMIISPTNLKEKSDSSEEIEIVEEITKTKYESDQNDILSPCDSNSLKSEKDISVDEPLNMSTSHLKELVSENLKTLLEKNTRSEPTSVTSSTRESSSNHSSNAEDSQITKPFEKLSNDETGFPKFFEGMVTIGEYTPVMGDFTLKGNEALIDCPSITTPFLVKKPDQFPPSEPKALNPNEISFNSSIGNFLIGIGFSRVREWYHRDMAKIKSHRIKNSGKTEELTQELKSHHTNYLHAKKANEHFVSALKTCKICNYATESSLILEGHMLIPHVTSRREFQCSYCLFLHRDPKTILDHMKLVHSKVGHIEHIASGYECPCCIFETNSRPKLTTHMNRCLKYFNHSINQAPIRDFEFPCLTPKPITVMIVKSYEKSIAGSTRGRSSKPIQPFQDQYQPQSYPYSNNLSKFKTFQTKNALPDSPLNQLYTDVNSRNVGISSVQYNSNNFHNVNSLVTNTSQSQYPVLPQRNKAIKTVHSNAFGNSFCRPGEFNKMSAKLPSNSLQLSRLQGPVSTSVMQHDKLPSYVSSSSNELVVCEICDGYIKDLEQLRMHMQLIHKIKINPKMLSSRPPLNCQKCFWRFFTDHGLERHLLGSHGLVTSNMQELAEKNKDAGCCTICGKVYASKLVAHMNQLHNIALKPANLSYKCTVCSATFNLYRLFESHVYLVHSGGTKRPLENDPAPQKSLKLNGPC